MSNCTLQGRGNVEVREMLVSDFDAVAEMLDLYRVFYHQLSDLEKTRAFLKMIFFDDDIVIFVARNPDTKDYCGFCTLFPSFSTVKASNIFVLNDLFVKEDHRRAGTGGLLLKFAEQYAYHNKAISLKLETASDNIQAQALYRKAGWTVSDFLVFGRGLSVGDTKGI